MHRSLSPFNPPRGCAAQWTLSWGARASWAVASTKKHQGSTGCPTLNLWRCFWVFNGLSNWNIWHNWLGWATWMKIQTRWNTLFRKRDEMWSSVFFDAPYLKGVAWDGEKREGIGVKLIMPISWWQFVWQGQNLNLTRQIFEMVFAHQNQIPISRTSRHVT